MEYKTGKDLKMMFYPDWVGEFHDENTRGLLDAAFAGLKEGDTVQTGIASSLDILEVGNFRFYSYNTVINISTQEEASIWRSPIPEGIAAPQNLKRYIVPVALRLVCGT